MTREKKEMGRERERMEKERGIEREDVGRWMCLVHAGSGDGGFHGCV